MRRVFVAVALGAVSLIATPAAQACAWNQCSYLNPVCHGPVDARCGTGARDTTCNWVDLPDPVC